MTAFITFGNNYDDRQPLSEAAEYLLMQAGIKNGEYNGADFIHHLQQAQVFSKQIHFDRLSQILDEQGNMIKQAAMQSGDKVFIEEFNPNYRSLEDLMKTPIE